MSAAEASAPSYATRPTVYRADLFAGRTVLVSGGGSGLGKAIAFLFGRLGARVAICGRKAERIAAAASSMREAGITVEAIPCNIRSPEEVATLMERVGPLDILVNNAGGQFPQPAIDFSPKGWNAVIDTNLNGTWHMMQAAAQRWRAATRGGTIVNIVAVVERGMPGVAHTCAARAGIIHLARTVAVEWAPLGIRINCVAPGTIETEGMAVYPPEARATFPRSNPMLRMGDPWDIAEACVYLAGPSGQFITGETLTVDGGGRLWGELWTAGKPAYFE
jgi:citronellol/citronellal dehydrogenase